MGEETTEYYVDEDEMFPVYYLSAEPNRRGTKITLTKEEFEFFKTADENFAKAQQMIADKLEEVGENHGRI
jgi:hypothetical protein